MTTDDYYRMLAANTRAGIYTPPMDPLLTDPVETSTNASFIDILKGIGNVLLPGSPFGPSVPTLPTAGPSPVTNLMPWLLPPTPAAPPPQVPQIAGRVAVAAGPGLARWLSLAWKMLVSGSTAMQVVDYLTQAVPATQEQAALIVEKAVRTRGGGRRMNPLNPRALRRAITRINRFDKFANHTEKVLRRYARRK